MNQCIKGIISMVDDIGEWSSKNSIFGGAPEEESQLILECLSCHNMVLTVSGDCKYCLSRRSDKCTVVSKGFIKELLSSSTSDFSSFSHFISECCDLKTLRRVPSKFSMEAYVSDEKLQGCVDELLLNSTQFFTGWQLGLILEKGNFSFVKVVLW